MVSSSFAEWQSSRRAKVKAAESCGIAAGRCLSRDKCPADSAGQVSGISSQIRLARPIHQPRPVRRLRRARKTRAEPGGYADSAASREGMETLPGQPFQGVDKSVAETGIRLLEAAKRPYRLAPRARGERPPRKARPVRGSRSRNFASAPSPADADVVGLSPTGRGEDLGHHEHLERGALPGFPSTMT